jgi:hypothetical protein
VAEDETTVVELVKALSESVTFSEGLLDLAEGLLLRPETGRAPESRATNARADRHVGAPLRK